MLGDEVLPGESILARYPEFEFSVVKESSAVLRFQWGMRQERIRVARFEGALGALQRYVCVAIASQFRARPAFEQIRGCCCVVWVAVAFRRRQVPFHLQQATRFFGLPVRSGHHGHAIHQRIGAAHPLERQHGNDAGRRLGGGKARRKARLLEASTMGGSALEHGVQHAWQANVDTEQWRTRHHLRCVHAALRLADDAELGSALQWNGSEVWCGQCRSRGCQLAVGPLALCGCMVDLPVAGGEFSHRHAGVCRRGLQQHLACGGTGLAQWQPIGGGRHAATGALRPKARGVEGSVYHLHLRPVAVQFLGDEHGQRGFDALSDLGVLAGNGHLAVGVQGDPEGKGGGCGREGGRGLGIGNQRRHALCHPGKRQFQHQAAAHERGSLQEGSTAHDRLGHQGRGAGLLHVSFTLGRVGGSRASAS